MSTRPAHRQLVSFGPYEADLDASELRKRGRKIRLQEKPFAVLAALVERPGELVTREELRERLWPDDTVVVFDDNLNTAVGKLRAALGDTAKNPRFVETLPRRGYRFIADTQTKRLPTADSPPRIAVLPLDNLSRNPEQEYFADGMTDAIITDLAKLGAMSVISRTSIIQYKGVRKPIGEIANELGVSVILEGSVLRSGDRVRVTAQLIDAESDRHLWGESFDRELRDVLNLQSELARAIAAEIRVQLSAEDEARLSRTRKVDELAHDAYLKGRYCLNQRTEEELEKAIRYFEQAIERDPSYAAVYAGLSDAYSLLVAGGYGAGAPAELIPKARNAALEALARDDTLADVHASLGYLKFKMDWDWAGAEHSFRRAIELNPSSVTAHHWYALCLMSMVRLDEALSETTRAHELDPR
jgi:TolB-like protein